ncbi:aminoglycoside adenylyltransferase domain-containing protein [Jeotgalibacillus sp. R-1-5s-1]|uniref:aminoglycoside adenylyltransferase domain-containing protein n=1 Tax=Jeotgalibacillus sp. R-1-5s-1 TaxID=2555897 RepID=UPI00106C8167|nr:aminoglycoside adenylyltransferase domain-containing protein [Jeotgalibacillus sp. R-1-5s-1]TFD93575.1 DUF4111 domain-containing protein [Jeotgalibacillus sp. R-1-5s-1]
MSVIQKIDYITEELKNILGDTLKGIYLHGSMALGGFQHHRSDLDLIGVITKRMTNEQAKQLTDFILRTSNQPFPIEISFLQVETLEKWIHPATYEYHYSEIWRPIFEEKTVLDSFLNSGVDPDLTAHLAVLHQAGLTLFGPPVKDAFPSYNSEDLLITLQSEMKDCLLHITEDPIYCSLNLLRYWRYEHEGIICSKLEGAEWSLNKVPASYRQIILQIIKCYKGTLKESDLERENIKQLSLFIQEVTTFKPAF